MRTIAIELRGPPAQIKKGKNVKEKIQKGRKRYNML